MASIIMATPIGITNTPERYVLEQLSSSANNDKLSNYYRESSNRLSFSDDENEGRAFVASYSQVGLPW